MKSVEAEIEGITIVLIGSFNPGIFQPIWFASQKLLPESEAENATINVITSDIAVFSLGWASLSIEKERFIIECNQPPFYEAARDLVAGTFRILRHTPAKYLGINYHSHFRLESAEACLRLGHLLAPKIYWTDVLKNPLLHSMRMISDRPDQNSGSLNVTIEPSQRVNPGVFIQVNDHLTASEDQQITTLISLLGSIFQDSVARANDIMQHLLVFRDENKT
jgi:hypothetical protein